MTITANVGLSRADKAAQAGSEAARQAMATLDAPADLIIAFTNDRYDQAAVIQGIRSVTGQALLIGCSAPGVFSSEGFSTDSVAVMALRAKNLNVVPAMGEGIDDDPRQLGETVAETLLQNLSGAEDEYMVALTLVNPFSPFTTTVVQSTSDTLGPLCPLIGGGAGNNFKSAQTFQFINEEISSDALAAVLLQSSTPLGIGISHGYRPVGRPLIVTRSDNNIIYELDGQPAFEFYQQAWAGEAPDLELEEFRLFAKAHPLGLPQLRGEYVIRDLVGINPDGAIECASMIPENAVVYMMATDHDGLITAARDAAKEAIAELDGRPPAAVMVFDCATRLLLLGDDIAQDVDHIRDVIGPETPLIGMFSFGEIASPPQGGQAAFYNKTVVVCALAQT